MRIDRFALESITNLDHAVTLVRLGLHGKEQKLAGQVQRNERAAARETIAEIRDELALLDAMLAIEAAA